MKRIKRICERCGKEQLTDEQWAARLWGEFSDRYYDLEAYCWCCRHGLDARECEACSM